MPSDLYGASPKPDSRADILQALDLAQEFKLRIIWRGGEEAWRVAEPSMPLH
jgi:hypothetical protein